MKANIPHVILACVVGIGLLTGDAGAAPAFDSGSDGSYGALIVTNETTLDMPADGIFKCTTILITTNGVLRFKKNSLNTPVSLLARGDVVINGVIDVTGSSSDRDTRLPGRGGPGGFDGGYGPVPNSVFASEGQGPGGGRFVNNGFGGAFAYNSGNNANTNTYGNRLLLPLIGGSGGAGSPSESSDSRFAGGGGGGGAILIASSTRIHFENPAGPSSDRINAYGGSGFGGGSGGAIRLVAPVVSGSGRLHAGGNGSYITSGYNGGEGYVRIDTLDRNAFRSLQYVGTWSVGCQMISFPPGNPHLDVLQVAGFEIPEGTSNAVRFFAPAGLTNTVVKVKATGFTGTNALPVTVSMTPDKGSAVRTEGVIPLTGASAGMALIPITLPQDAVSTLQVWTR